MGEGTVAPEAALLVRLRLAGPRSCRLVAGRELSQLLRGNGGELIPGWLTEELAEVLGCSNTAVSFSWMLRGHCPNCPLGVPGPG